jgi:glucose-6-phosphate dehydrogenase assembly protein OpcA
VEAPVIVNLPNTNTSAVNSRLVRLRQEGGATTLGRVLTLVIVTDDGSQTEEAIDAANEASREHPCRVIVVARGSKRAAARLDAEIRVGGDAGASEVVVLRLYGPLADEGASCVIPLLLPDTPVVAWWPDEAPAVPAKDPIGQLAARRITDAANDRNPVRALEHRRSGYTEGDTDLAWTRLTLWRSYLAAALELPPFERVTAVEVSGEADSPSTDLLAAWLATRLKCPVNRIKATSGEGIVKVTLRRRSGEVTLHRPDGRTGTLSQPGQPERQISLRRRFVRDCLAEELRRLDADEIYAETLRGLAKITRGRPAAKAKPATKPAAAAKAPAAAKPAAKPAAKAAAKAAPAKPAKAAEKKPAGRGRPAPRRAARNNGAATNGSSATGAAASSDAATAEVSG